ncbi:MAG TPA: alternative ribosome rescue aminoacyl-tRNA hydrolase ArfB [Cyclobacteriaceae bacterium]|nr:aminoacyl-tRNA hydrolase [Cyclobacteriaceae bacterium]HMV11256.1 alternative ribosome rescue aminoacyl-tRNA hydrolase ArfB [Cyclobacteriaceae bacterium]HMV91594.1 alternative ribosome rescue aminoacyl-tRNA hydrolase ArfB [Cyclobacteriaceae bacterium]HMX01707.1 alternative ribosome rescue aminoacyl-tRNA hydrolase ArfB [Cyclobacteriaceae bacterium]HMX51384.1 alternative ribosome rescue aminoacyl-tRNA hydrolase ArfB [Cyclobacteriaceae bacterium]
MSTRKLTTAILLPELLFSASRSSGPGGQNVNKVNSRITLRFNIRESTILTYDEKSILLTKLGSRLTEAGELIVHAQDKRSQLQNKEAVMAKFDVMLAKAFEKKKARKATKPSKTAVQKRINSKKKRSEKKQWRQKPD